MTTSPILLLIFNRPDLTALVMETICSAAPARFYVAADAPRDLADEIDRCEQARQIATSVGWPCEMYKLFRSQNLGRGLAARSALDWFFEREEAGIILEDDCVPHRSFFPYCDELLDRYRHDTRIMAISGDNFQTGESSDPYSYYFSRFFHCWGWATWRRAWALYDRDMRLWSKFRDAGMLRSWSNQEPQFEQYWTNCFDTLAAGGERSWDARYLFTCWVQNGLTCTPRVNLVTNLGFQNDSTNAADPWIYLGGLPAREIEIPLHHPPIVCRAVEADRAVQRFCFGHPWLANAAAPQQTAEESENVKTRPAGIEQLEDELSKLEQQLNSQIAQSAEKVRQLEEQVDRARRLCHSMSSSLSWRLTLPLRFLRDAVAAILKGVKRRDDLMPENRSEPELQKTNLPHFGEIGLFVNSLYRSAFGRLAEPKAVVHHIHQLKSGVSPELLAEGLVSSAEFRARHGSSQKVDKEFLIALYRDGLGRQPDPEGLAHWLKEGERGATRAEVLAVFAASPEAARRALQTSSNCFQN